MLLDSVQTLSSFPEEKIGIFLNNTIVPEISSRLGVRFKSHRYDGGDRILNWNALSLRQGGAEPFLNGNPLWNQYYDINFTNSFVQPTNFINIPSDFPVFFPTSAIPHDYVFLNFRGGLSGITVFPTRAYPQITKVNNNTINVSAVMLYLSAFNGEVSSDNYYKSIDASNLSFFQNLESSGTKLTYNSGYSSAHKQNILWKIVTSNALQNIIFNNDAIPASVPYDHDLIPQSFRISFSLSAASLPAVFNYVMSYSNSIGNNHYLSALGIESYYSNSLSAYVTPVNPIANYAYLQKNTNSTYGLNIKLDPSYVVPKFSNITYYYDTSSTSVSSQIAASNLNSSYFSLSTSNPIYFYNFQFDLSANKSSDNINDAITIYYSPSALITETTLSSVSVDISMVDNFYQTSFPILVGANKMRIKFIENQNDKTLSAIDQQANHRYIYNEWFPASAHIKFINDGMANSHSISFQLSGSNNNIYNFGNTTFLLNKNNANLSLALTETSDTSAYVVGNIFPQYAFTENVIWTAYPPDNIVLIDPYTKTNIPLNTNTPAGSLEIIATNLGVDKTQISLYMSEFDISATTLWFPSSAVYNSVNLQLSTGVINDFSPNNNSTISAIFVKNNMNYPAPEDALISWTETLHDPNGTLILNNGDDNIIDNTIYPSTRKFSNINLRVATKKVPENPQNVSFNINCNLYSQYYNLANNISFSVREYPSNANIYASLTAENGTIINTFTTSSTYLLSSMMVTAFALTSDFAYLQSSNIKWHTPPDNTVYGISAIFPMTSSFCLGISAFNAKPVFGGFGFYDFSNKCCIYVYPNGLSALDYIAFPEYKHFPEKLLSITDNSYLSSDGLSGVKSCDSQNFIISTFGGFDEYYFKIGNVVKYSTSPVETLSIRYNDVSADNTVAISAYNAAFPISNPLSIYNSASSDNSNVFKQNIAFLDMPSIEGNLQTDQILFDLSDINNNFFDINLIFEPTYINCVSATFTYVLSSRRGIKYSPIKTVYSNVNVFNDNFTLSPNDFFNIHHNSSNIFNFFISGNIVKGLPNNNLCNITQSISSNIVTLTAYTQYDPTLQIFTKYNLNPTNTPVYFDNLTPDNFAETFDYFIFDDGNNHTQIVSAYATSLTGIYFSEGIYNVSLSGVYPTGRIISNIWTDFIIAKDNYLDFDENISRKFPNKLKLPHNKNEMGIPPNDWQFDNKINAGLEKIKTNFDYLSSMTVTYDITVPKYFIGWVAEKEGTLEWNYNFESPSSQIYSEQFTTLKSFHIENNRVYLINGNKLEIRNNDSTLSLIYSSEKITEGETFKTPNEIIYNDALSKIIVLDTATKFVYVFDVNTDVPILTHYWGGVGGAESRTKLNNPTDVHIDTLNYIFIVDSDSLVVKIYNKFLNWTENITHYEWSSINKPISISDDSEYYYVLTTNGLVYIFDTNYSYISKFQATKGNKIYSTTTNKGIIYIAANSVYVYTRTGIFLNTLLLPDNSPEIIKITTLEKETYLLTSFSILKIIDYIGIKSIKTDYYSLSSWNWDSILIKNREPITSFVFNDAFKKIQDNIQLLSKDITEKFVINIDEYDNFVNHTISAIRTDEIILSSFDYTSMGINEIVSYDTINILFNNVYDNLEKLRDMLEVRYNRNTGDFICWSWKAQSIKKPHNPVITNKPFSWYELRQNIAQKNVYLSGGMLSAGITWADMWTCCGIPNHSYMKWAWEKVSCCDIIPVKWIDTECGMKYSNTWQQVEEDCEILPIKYFDDCESVC